MIVYTADWPSIDAGTAVFRMRTMLAAGRGRIERDVAVPAQLLHAGLGGVVRLGHGAFDRIERPARIVTIGQARDPGERRHRLLLGQRLPGLALRLAGFALERAQGLHETHLRAGGFHRQQAIEELRHARGTRAGHDLFTQYGQRVEGVLIEELQGR